GDVRKVGRVGLRAFAYTLVISGISVAIGLTLVNTIRPGERISPETALGLEVRYGAAAAAQVEAAPGDVDVAPLTQLFETLIPSNPIASAASATPNLLHLMFFGLVLGVAATLLAPQAA